MLTFLRIFATISVMWIVGAVLFSFGFGVPLICLFCGIPMTRRLSAIIPANKSAIYIRMSITITMWAAISAAVIWAVMRFGDAWAVGSFWGGFCLTALAGAGKLGMNQDNIEDYFRSYGKFYDQDALAPMLETLEAFERAQDEETE